MLTASNDQTQMAQALLLVEDNPGDARLLREYLTEGWGPFEVVEVTTLTHALVALTQHEFKVVLCDLNLPDSQGLNTLIELHRATTAPLIVLTGMDDEALAIASLKHGAQDYLRKSHYDGDLLARSIRYAIERHRLMQEILGLSLRDELTGLYNRRGFLDVAEHQLKLARRNAHPLCMFYFDVNNLKEINDRLGHQVGDDAIRAAAKLLCQSFRDTDVIGRLGGDEFAAMAIEIDLVGAAAITARLHALEQAANTANAPYPLSFSLGVVVYDPKSTDNLSLLLERADQAMYRNKQRLSRA